MYVDYCEIYDQNAKSLLNITQKLLRGFEIWKILLSSLFHCKDPEGSQAKLSDVSRCQSREIQQTYQNTKGQS